MAASPSGLVARSWKRLGPMADRAANLFYDHLLEVAPAARARLAPERMPEMRRALVARIDAAIGGAVGKQPPPAAGAPQDLLLGAPPAAGLEALLRTVRDMLAVEWSDDLAAAWASESPRLLQALAPASAAA
ncbi:hypothetical protein [Roseomonas sp. HF4]|uniref:hypothetical protein n=1 Tax=Roseomonas sp. HF4 TaxID=2562313 RepID=UPI0010C023B3|nr:hypothetical protein [Roseomonas sp. HF4]